LNILNPQQLVLCKLFEKEFLYCKHKLPGLRAPNPQSFPKFLLGCP
jgi:hypothetical protein